VIFQNAVAAKDTVLLLKRFEGFFYTLFKHLQNTDV